MESSETHFAHVLRVAERLSDGENAVNSLLALARLVGREFAYESFLYEVGPTHGSGPGPFVPWRRLASAYGIHEETRTGERVWLAWDPVLTQPWNEFRLTGALRKLSRGPASHSERWRFDPRNHYIALWLPM